MIDLSSKKALSQRINELIDAAIVAENKKQSPRRYLGGSRIGVECERQLQFEFFNVEKDAGKNFDGRTLRVFERGHVTEDMVIKWLTLAGVVILTMDDDFNQYGFSEIDGLFQGHCDGIITSGPDVLGPFPRLWENKCVKASKWNALSKHGLLKEAPVYWAQCQCYMNKLSLSGNPALFSAVNADTMEIYWESVPFNPGASQQLDAKAHRIIQACLHGELLPRASTDPSFFTCKWCSWAGRCWSL